MRGAARLAGLALCGALASCSPARDDAPTEARKPEPKLVLVSGVTGRQGGAVARQLLAKGYRVRGLTRKPDSEHAKTAAGWGVELVKGDFDDRASLDRALAGAYGAFSVQDFWEHGREGEVRQGKAFADAAKAAGVSHFVYSSVGSANRKTGIPHFESKWEVEEHVRAIGLPHTILRPVSFMENWDYSREQIEGGTVASPLSPTTRLQQIAVEDIGRIAAESFDDPARSLGRELDIAGDERTMQEITAEFERALGRPVRYVQVPWDRFLGTAGEEITTMYRWFEGGGYQADVAGLRAEFPFLTPFPAFVDVWAGHTALARSR
jgi:uncharacterized protein YbjT (DUF2867 family)